MLLARIMSQYHLKINIINRSKKKIIKPANQVEAWIQSGKAEADGR